MYKNERKTRNESRDFDQNNIVQWLSETFDIFAGKRPSDVK